LTVNFNFDDLVDEAAINSARDRNKEQPEIISRAKIETRKGASVIYHINGHLPREARRRRSEGLVFTEHLLLHRQRAPLHQISLVPKPPI
jgi:hypothetical protein